jgi:hypothetical protein
MSIEKRVPRKWKEYFFETKWSKICKKAGMKGFA